MKFSLKILLFLLLPLAPMGAWAAEGITTYDFEHVIPASPAVEEAAERAGAIFSKPLILPAGWKFNPTSVSGAEYRLVEADAPSGTHSVYVKGHLQCEHFFPVTGEGSLGITFQAKSNSGDATINGALYLYDDAYRFLGEQRIEQTADLEWNAHSMDLEIPTISQSGVAVAHIAVALGSNSGAYFDDVTIAYNPGASEAKEHGKQPEPHDTTHESNAAASVSADPLIADTTIFAPELLVNAEGTETLTFKLGDFAGKQIRLRLDARIDWGGLGGSTSAMAVEVNGQGVVGRRLMNKPLAFTMREGTVLHWTERNASIYRLMYSNDFSDRLQTDTNYPYGLPEENQHPFQFLWDITSYVLPGVNSISISSPSGTALNLALRDVAIELGDPIAYEDPSGQPEIAAPAPTGPLPVYAPKTLAPFMRTVEISSTGDIRFKENGETYNLHTRSSLPHGKWTKEGGASGSWRAVAMGGTQSARWEGADYEVNRRITVDANRIAVRDTIKNRSAKLLGVILENRMELPAEADQTLLAGREATWVTETQSAFHPTVLATLDSLAVGLVAENDLFRVHATLFRGERLIGLADRSLGIPPKGEQTLEWSIYALPQGNYWDFVNAIRRDWGSNIALTGPVTFTGTSEEWGHQWAVELDEQRLTSWLDKRNNAVPMIMTHVATDPNVAPAVATKERQFWYHGTAVPHATHWLESTRAITQLLKKVDPSIRLFAYLHPNLSTEVGYENKYRDSVALDVSGNPAQSVYKPEPGLFIPTRSNSYGVALKKVYQQLIDDLDANLYIDEITVGIPAEGAYAEWDQSTVRIDPASHAVIRKLSSARLLMQPWLDDMVAYAKSNGKTLFVNTAPPTRTMLNWRIQHITEDTGPAGISSTHLSTPLAWTYDIGELAGFQHIRESLFHGAISFSRSGSWSDKLFPLTPIEIHAGMIIGEERILTNHSGKFGWGDHSKSDVLVFDGSGQRVETPNIKEVREAHQTFTELRMPGDHFAILIRKPVAP